MLLIKLCFSLCNYIVHQGGYLNGTSTTQVQIGIFYDCCIKTRNKGLTLDKIPAEFILQKQRMLSLFYFYFQHKPDQS